MALTNQQIVAFDQSIPSLGSSLGNSAGSIIQNLITSGGDPRSVSLGTGANGTVAGVLNAVYATYTTNATANTADAVTHTLGRVPIGYEMVNNGNGGVVYNGGGTNTATSLSVKCTTASNAVTLLIF